jgi:hypothetical protein
VKLIKIILTSKLLQVCLWSFLLMGRATAETNMIGRTTSNGVIATLWEMDNWKTLVVQVESPYGYCSNGTVTFRDTTDNRILYLYPNFGTSYATDGTGLPICLTQAWISHPNGVPGYWTVTGMVDGRYWSVSGAMDACRISGTPMQVAEQTSYGDFFYALDSGQINYAFTLGYQPSTANFSVERDPSLSARPFRRFYYGAPQIEHFYTINDNDVSIVLNFGYAPEGNEGYIYAVQKPNAVELRRWSNFNGANYDLKHFYAKPGQYPPGPGWIYEGVVGYACN